MCRLLKEDVHTAERPGEPFDFEVDRIERSKDAFFGNFCCCCCCRNGGAGLLGGGGGLAAVSEDGRL